MMSKWTVWGLILVVKMEFILLKKSREKGIGQSTFFKGNGKWHELARNSKK